jgi:hypothetical protein
MAGEDLGSGAYHAPHTGIGEVAGKVVPAADVAPYLGVLRKVGADRLVWDAEQVIERPGCFIPCLRSLP